MADGCVFCRIIAGELPAHVVLEDEGFVAFLDARSSPVTCCSCRASTS
jgi:diadenosine tetraphosphate (Ap4A) HIT family hydrolase